MVRIDATQMRRRRIELGLTAEQLAEMSGLDPRTIRRLERGNGFARLHTAVAVAEALGLDTSTFLLTEPNETRGYASRETSDFFSNAESSATGPSDAMRSRSAAIIAAEKTIHTELTSKGDQALRETMHVSSLLLTTALAMEGEGSAELNDEGAHKLVAAFKAADVAIRTTLSSGGEWGIEEAISVLSLLLARYGMAFSRRSEKGPIAAFEMVHVTFQQASLALSHYIRSKKDEAAVPVSLEEIKPFVWLRPINEPLEELGGAGEKIAPDDSPHQRGQRQL